VVKQGKHRLMERQHSEESGGEGNDEPSGPSREPVVCRIN
jgi:hypothetical protein